MSTGRSTMSNCYDALFDRFVISAGGEYLDDIGDALGVRRHIYSKYPESSEPDMEYRGRMLDVVSPVNLVALEFMADAASQGIDREERELAYKAFRETQARSIFASGE